MSALKIGPGMMPLILAPQRQRQLSSRVSSRIPRATHKLFLKNPKRIGNTGNRLEGLGSALVNSGIFDTQASHPRDQGLRIKNEDN